MVGVCPGVTVAIRFGVADGDGDVGCRAGTAYPEAVGDVGSAVCATVLPRTCPVIAAAVLAATVNPDRRAALLTLRPRRQSFA